MLKSSLVGKGLTDFYEQEKRTVSVRFHENEARAPKPVIKELDNTNKAENMIDPIYSIQMKASKTSAVEYEIAHTIDDPGNDIISKLNEAVFQKLSERFFANIYDDPEDWFRQIFERHNREDIIINFTEYLIQRFGGGSAYSGRRGFPSLFNRHGHIKIPNNVVLRWLSIMDDTLDEMGDDIDDDSRDEIFNFLKYTAHAIGASQEEFHDAEFAKGNYSSFHE